MKSRYDYMEAGQVLDSDNQLFPDPLTIDYIRGRLTKIPTEYKITARDLARFWTFMWEQYGMTELDDLVLNINGCPYLMTLQPGDSIYKPTPEDIVGFIQNKQIGYDD